MKREHKTNAAPAEERGDNVNEEREGREERRECVRKERKSADVEKAEGMQME